MVSTEVTQNSPQSSSDSVRITAQVRRQILREHYTERLEAQQQLVADEANDRNALGPQQLTFSHADLRVSNKAAVLQDISAMVKSFGDENRDFPQVTR